MKYVLAGFALLLAGCEASVGPKSTPAPPPTPVPPQIIYVQPPPQVSQGADPILVVFMFGGLILLAAVFFLIGLLIAGNRRSEPPPQSPIYFQGMPERGLLTEVEAFCILRSQGFTPEAANALIQEAKRKQLPGGH